MTVNDFFAEDSIVDHPAVINGLTVAQRALDAPLILVALHGAPFTLALNDILGDSPRGMGTHDGDVGTIALTQEATPYDAKQAGRIVAHQFHQTLYGKHALVD